MNEVTSPFHRNIQTCGALSNLRVAL